VQPIVHEALRSPGQPLDPATRAFMEPRFGHDFSQVRVHMDDKAAESAQAVNATAYTVGRDIFWGSGTPAANTASGKNLLAHELTHVVQQSKTINNRDPIRIFKSAVILWPIGIEIDFARKCLDEVIEESKDVTYNFWKETLCKDAESMPDPKVANIFYDAFGHCWIACTGSRRCGKGWTKFGGWWHENISKGPHESRKQDLANQKLGIKLSGKKGNCALLCENAMYAEDGMDLSAPLIECWDCITHKVKKAKSKTSC